MYRYREALTQDTIDLMNANKAVQKAARDVLQMVLNELVEAQEQISELGNAVQQAPYAVVQNLEATLPVWIKDIQRVREQAVSAVKKQLDEMALRFEEEPSGTETVNVK